MTWDRLQAGWSRVKAMIRNRQPGYPSNSSESTEQRRRRREELIEQIQKMARDEARTDAVDPGRRN
jgi:hypothetical protein